MDHHPAIQHNNLTFDEREATREQYEAAHLEPQLLVRECITRQIEPATQLHEQTDEHSKHDAHYQHDYQHQHDEAASPHQESAEKTIQPAIECNADMHLNQELMHHDISVEQHIAHQSHAVQHHDPAMERQEN